MKRLILLALLLIGCAFNEGCPQAVGWKVKKTPPQCGFTVDSLQTIRCDYFVGETETECTYTQKRFCENGTTLTQHVDPIEGWASTTLETRDGCKAYFEGPVEVQ